MENKYKDELLKWYIEHISKELLDNKELKEQICEKVLKGQLSKKRAMLLFYYCYDH